MQMADKLEARAETAARNAELRRIGADDIPKGQLPARESQAEPLFVGLTAACETLNLSRPVIAREVRAGRLRARRFGRKVLFEPGELRRYAASLPAWEPK